ncbi:putative ubiquitin carboxyl-terminal hydrolase MINDY-4 isoform X1 [Brachyhypopomus gauderio]|uniref:putative ubiquitin carboxyl-terminal hydrolase MINDY-4 isoform X1 n=1 Tax=Brachyhypopomus gauderio TaxID=698409 RepID=UPI0040433DAE
MAREAEEVSASLVREYLSRKGLRKTIACLDEELPRTNFSINNRSDLRRVLHLEILYKRNKSEEQPLKSMLEMMVKERMRKCGDAKTRDLEDRLTFSAEQESLIPDSPSANDTTCVRRHRDVADVHRINLSGSESGFTAQLKASPAKEPRSPKTSSSVLLSETERSACPSSSQGGVSPSVRVGLGVDRSQDGQGTRSRRLRRDILSGPVTASTQETSRGRCARKPPGSYSLLAKSECDSDGVTRLSQSVSVDVGHTESARTVPSEREDDTFLSSSQNTVIDGLGGLHRVASPRRTSACCPRVGGLQGALMVLDDVDDEDLRSLSTLPIRNTQPQLGVSKRPMDQQTATALKMLIFGSPTSCFSAEWKQQSFTFSGTPGLRYGIVQKKGGPCGVLAAVQAAVLQKLLFEGGSRGSEAEQLQVSDAVRTRCLTDALTEILWRAGDGKKATVAINSGRRLFTPMGHYRSEGILELITCVEVESFTELRQQLDDHITQFESGPFGCILLFLSAVLSRTIEGTRGDMDTPTSSLIGAHGYCTQRSVQSLRATEAVNAVCVGVTMVFIWSGTYRTRHCAEVLGQLAVLTMELVSLLLVGQAVSNVFDDEMKLDSSNGNFTLLRGVSERSNVGLLSLFEHYNICKVGSHLKTPRFPIWVVCSESHFTTLFSLCEDLTSSRWKPRPFDLFYYDGLANQLEPIRLTVYLDSAVLATDSRDMNSDLIPPLELCIRTRWPDAVVSWNETEPIL